MKRTGQRLRILILLAATSLGPPPVAFPADSTATGGTAVPTAVASPAPADGFQAVSGSEEFGGLESAAAPDKHDHSGFRGEAKALRWVLGILFATIVAGLLVRFSVTRNLRAAFLTSSVALHRRPAQLCREKKALSAIAGRVTAQRREDEGS